MFLDSANKIDSLPKRIRGDYQDKFKIVKVYSNHYQVTLGSFDIIYTFKIKFTPSIAQDNKTLRNCIIKKAFPEIRMMIPNAVVSGMTIYTVCKPYGQEKQCVIEENGKTYIVSLKQVRQQNVLKNPKVLIQFLNNGLRNIMNRLDYTEIGRTNKFFNIKKMSKMENLMMFSGFRSNFTTLEKGIYLRVDTAKKIVRSQTVLQAINELYFIHNEKQRDQKRQIVKDELVGRIVMTNYGKTRYYRIENILFQDIQNVYLDGTTLNIIDYYKDKYQINIKVKKQPLLEVQNKRSSTKTFLIPQLCLMTGIPENFDEIRRKKISEATIRSVSERRSEIQVLMDQIKDSPELAAWQDLGIQINPEMQIIDAKIISAPYIALGKNKSIQDGKQAFFNLYSQPIYSNKFSVRLGLIYFLGVDVNNLTRIFEATAKNLQVDLEIIHIKGGDIDSKRTIYVIENLLRKAAQKQFCNICFIVLPNQFKQQYKKVKIQALIENRMVCQVALDSTLRKRSVQSICTKILLQIIAKRGNTLWVPKCNSILSKTMIVAFESAKTTSSKSLLSVCATLNSQFTEVFSKTIVCDGQTEKLQAMKLLFLAAVASYINVHEETPEQVIVFQNSCSGDQISLYLEYLVQPSISKLIQIYGQQKPSTTFVMVNTKTSQRFFLPNPNNDELVNNVSAGTLISSDVVSPYYDFYLISQACNKGSTVPNHYRVIYCDSKMQEGILQQLIYNQCFNYVNWTGSIKVPGILQYAKKCAKFNAQVLQQQHNVDQDLQTKLYYI